MFKIRNKSNNFKKKEYPILSFSDFLDFNKLVLKLKTQFYIPIYNNLSQENKIFVDNFKGNEIKKRAKLLIFENLNDLILKEDFYFQLLKYYGKKRMEEIESLETKKLKEWLGFLDKPFDKLTRREKKKLRWLNLYLLRDLFPESIVKIKRKGTIEAWIEAAVVALIWVVFLRTFFFQLYKIPTTSMVPTLMPGDKIFVSKLHYGPIIPFTKWRIKGFSKPQRGDVIVFIPPNDRKRAYIKRLIALEGERVMIKDGNVYINGKLMTDPKIAKNLYLEQGSFLEKDKEIFVPKGKFFFLGDNSLYSLDSRFWGFVNEEDILGKAIFIWWPPDRIRLIE